MKLKKVIAPIIITAFLLVYFGSFILNWSHIQLPIWGKLMGLLIPVGFMGVSIFVLVERIKEIRSGEEDDLGKY